MAVVERDLPPCIWQQESSDKDSWGAHARKLWERRFAEFAEFRPDQSQVLFTGIGGAVASGNGTVVRRWKDDSEIPPYVDLQSAFGEVPRALFLITSAPSADNVLGLRGLARTYKSQGVEAVIAVLTALAHERQDRQFFIDGQPILEVTTLRDTVEGLAAYGHIDGGLFVQPHSLVPIGMALEMGFPLLPVDAFDYLIQQAGLDQIPNPFVMGPDKGRKDEARRLATWLGCPVASARKTRDADGYPTVTIAPEVLGYIRGHNCTVVAADDETREGGTIGELARALDGYTSDLVVCVVKPIMAGDGRMSAVDHLSHPLITRVVVTDAVQPQTDTAPIASKLEVIPLGPGLMRLTEYLQADLVRPGDPLWLDPSRTGTSLRLDLSVEIDE